MAIIAVNESLEGRTHAVDNRGVRTYARVFLVRSDIKSETAAVVRGLTAQALGLPKVGDSFGLDDVQAVATNIAPGQQSADPTLWHVTISYSSDPRAGGQASTRPEDPLARPAIESIRFEKFAEPYEIDEDNRPVRNAADERFSPAPVREVSRPVLSIVRNQRLFAYSTATTFVDTVNASAFRGVQPGDGRMVGIGAVQRFEGGIDYWEVSYEVAFRRGKNDADGNRRGGWEDVLMDAGFRQIDATAPNGLAGIVIQSRDPADPSRILREDTPSEPWPLGADGKALGQGVTPRYLFFRPYRSAEWGPLNL